MKPRHRVSAGQGMIGFGTDPKRRFGVRLAALAALILACAESALAQTAPVLRLPGAGTVAGVVETRLRDGFDQRIRFEGGDGRNHAEIGLRNETGDLLLAFPPRLAKPSQFGIEGEIAVRFPGQVMRIVAPRRNAYGPIGLALGADCLYAWQWFERASAAQRVASRTGLFDAGIAPTAGRRALSLRIRLCRTAQASLDHLVASVERLTISLPGEGGTVRSAPVRPRPAHRRAAPAPVKQQANRPTAPTPPPEAAPKPAPSSPQAAPALRPPAPTPGDAGRRYLAPTNPEGTAPATEPPASSAAPGGPQRFITDVPKPGEPQGRDLMPSPAPGRSTSESLSRDLPPEAYRPTPSPGGR
ncbi:cellulose biosynthesis protein BcsN [Methylorubrum populi]